MDEQTKSAKPAILCILIGVLFLLVDIRIKTGIAYPKYVLLEEYGTSIQQMVMGEVVGSALQIDLVSDLAGLILVAIGCIRALPIAQRTEKADKYWRRGSIFAIAGSIFYLFRMVMPYLLHGAVLYASEYGIHFLIAVLEALAVFHALSGILWMCECVESHRIGIVSELFLLLAVVCGYISSMGAFYHLLSVKWIYVLAQYILTLLGLLMLFRMKRYWMRGEANFEKDL